MFAGSLGNTRYLLLTEFEGRSACYGPSFFRSDLWPKHKARRDHKSSRKTRLVLTVSTYVINQQNFWGISILHGKETWDGRNPYRVVNDSSTYSRIFGGLGNNFPNGSFLKDSSCTKHHHLVFAGVYCNEKQFISRTVTILQLSLGGLCYW